MKEKTLSVYISVNVKNVNVFVDMMTISLIKLIVNDSRSFLGHGEFI